MQNPPSDEMSSLPSCGVGFPPVDERRLLEELDETGKRTHTCLPCINHLSQVTSGSGRT